MFRQFADYTKEKMARAFQYFPLGWLGKAKVEGTPQSAEVFSQKIKQQLSVVGNHVRFLPYADRYVEETDAIRKAYPIMLRDPYVKQALYTKVFGVASLDLQMHPVSKSSRDKDVAEFLKYCLQKSKGGTRRAIMNIAIPGAIFGHSVTEIKLKPPTGRGQYGSKITLDALKSKDVNRLTLEGNEFGDISGVRDRTNSQFYHHSNFLIYTNMPLFESPTGISDFRAAYRAYWLADTAWQLRAIGLERYGLPVLKGEYASADQQYALEQQMPNIRSQGWFTIPEGAKVEAMEIAGRGTTDFESAIRDLREEMVLAIAGAILQMLTTTGTAEMRGSADVQKGTFELLQWYLAQETADVFNDQLFPSLVDLNYRGADYPTCTFGGVSDGAMKDSITVDQFFLQNALPLSKEEMYEKYGRQQPLNEEDAVKGPQPQMPFGGGQPGGMPGGAQFAEDGITDPQQTAATQAKQIMAVQQVYASGKIPRSAAIANAQLIKPDLAPDAAAALFPVRQSMPDGTAEFDESFAEKWITTGSAGDGKPGRKILIDDKTGEIKGGNVPKAMHGKPIRAAKTHDTSGIANEYKTLFKSANSQGNRPSFEDLDNHIAKINKLPLTEVRKIAAEVQLKSTKNTKKEIVQLLHNRLKDSLGMNYRLNGTDASPETKPVESPAKPKRSIKPPADHGPVTDTDRQHVMKGLEGSPVHDLGDLRKRLSHVLPGAKFDKAILDLADSRKIQITQDADPARWTAAQKKQFVQDGGKVYTNVAKIGDSVSVGTTVKKRIEPLREIPADQVAKARSKVLANPLSGMTMLGIGRKIKEAKDGKADSSDVFEHAKKQLSKLHPTEIDQIARAYGIDTEKLFKHGNRANLVADAISQKFAPASEKWSMNNPSVNPFLPTSLISKVAKGPNARFSALFKETGDFTDGRVIISAPSWRNLKAARDYQPHEMEKEGAKRFAPILKSTRDSAFENRSGRDAGVVARRMHAGTSHYGLSDGERSESVDGRYHELILKTHPGSTVHLNKKEGGPISYVKNGVPVAILMPMGNDRHAKPPVANPPPVAPAKSRRGSKHAEFDDDQSTNTTDHEIYWPDVRQENAWDCGPACVVAAGRFSGVSMPEMGYVARECATDQKLGTLPGKIVRVLKSYGVNCAPKTNMSLMDLEDHVRNGRPVIVHVTNWDGEDHYMAIIGENSGRLDYHDPDGGYGQILDTDFLKHWDGKDRFGVRYPRWGVAIYGRYGEGGPEKFDDHKDPADAIIADAPHQDTDNAIRLSRACQQNGVEVIAKITEQAVNRLAESSSPLQASTLFTHDEKQELADALASTLATSDLLGRSRTHIRADEVRKRGEGFKFSEPTSFQRFDDDPSPNAAAVSALPPSSALAYFKSLVPTISVPSAYTSTVANRAFTLAGVTETSVLNRVKDVIRDRLETGRSFQTAPRDIQEVLDDAGVSVRNPQYSENVFRTNMMQAYTNGTMDSMRDPDVADVFPVWQYHGIRDGRQRLQHQAHFGKYFGNDTDFESVRDHFYNGDFSGWNCLLPGNLVSGRFTKAFKSIYQGKTVKITCASGSSVWVTPNHPILSESGFIPAAKVAKGSNLVSYENGIDFNPNNKKNCNARVEDIFCSLSKFSDPILFRPTSLDFHGDGEFFKEEVNVIDIERELANKINPQITKGSRYAVLAGASLSACSLSTYRTLSKTIQGVGTSSSSNMGFSDLLESESGILDPTPFGLFGFGLVSQGDSGTKDSFSDGLARYPSLFGKLIERFPAGVSVNKRLNSPKFIIGSPGGVNILGPNLDSEFNKSFSERFVFDKDRFRDLFNGFPAVISLDKVVHVEVLHYHGPVFDFESDVGYYVANLPENESRNKTGLVISNCRCNPSPVSKYEWKRLQEKGENVSELGTYPMPTR